MLIMIIINKVLLNYSYFEYTFYIACRLVVYLRSEYLNSLDTSINLRDKMNNDNNK